MKTGWQSETPLPAEDGWTVAPPLPGGGPLATGSHAVRRVGLRLPLAGAVFRLLLIAGAGVVLVRLPWSDLSLLFDPAAALEGGSAAAFAVLLFVSGAAAVLTLNYPGRADVVLLTLPVSLAWWHLGVPAATVLAAAGALAGNAVRRRPALPALAGAARITLATAVALAVVNGLWGPGGATPLTLEWAGGAAAFFALASAGDTLLDWLDTNLRGRPDRTARTDVLTNLALVPMSLFLHFVSLRLGFDRLAVLLTGLVALLFVVRTTVNLRTLHGALRRLHRTVVEERETLATLFLHSGEGIYTVDDRLRITAINPAMATLLDQPAQLVAGRTCVQVCHFLDDAGQELCPQRCPLRQAQAHGQPVSQEVVYAPPGRPPKHLLLTYAAAGDPGGHLRLGIGIARDVSVQKEAERLRRDFVSLVTHELRSPLTISIGYVSMLRRALQAAAPLESPADQGPPSGNPLDEKPTTPGPPPPGALGALGAHPAATPPTPLSPTLDERVWRYLDRIEGAEQHLLRLVNSLLEMARLQRTDLPLEYHQVAVDHLVEDAVEAITATAEAKGLVIQRDIPAGLPRLWSSALYLQEIVNNLLDNAVKYTPEGGRVSVTVQVGPAPARSDATAGDAAAAGAETLPVGATALPWLHITVADTGYGISEADMDCLFTQFFRSNQPEVRREPGTGLGLAFTKQMVDRIGGSIDVRSTRGAGSTFTVAFPLLSPEQSTPPPRFRDHAATPAASPSRSCAARALDHGAHRRLSC